MALMELIFKGPSKRAVVFCLDHGWTPCMAWQMSMEAKLLSIWVQGKKNTW